MSNVFSRINFILRSVSHLEYKIGKTLISEENSGKIKDSENS